MCAGFQKSPPHEGLAQALRMESRCFCCRNVWRVPRRPHLSALQGSMWGPLLGVVTSWGRKAWGAGGQRAPGVGGRCSRVFPARPLSGRPSQAGGLREGGWRPALGGPAQPGETSLPSWASQQAVVSLHPPGDGQPWAQENSSNHNTCWDLHASGRDPLCPHTLRSSFCVLQSPV